MAERLRLGESLLQRTLAELRSCGQGREECVAYWTGPLSDRDRVDDLLHPVHRAARGGYEVDQQWLAETWNALGRDRRTIRVQVHTHPGPAFHSRTDDRYPVVASAGFLSLVIPRFAREPQTLADAHLAHLEADGSWSTLNPREALLGDSS